MNKSPWSADKGTRVQSTNYQQNQPQFLILCALAGLQNSCNLLNTLNYFPQSWKCVPVVGSDLISEWALVLYLVLLVFLLLLFGFLWGFFCLFFCLFDWFCVCVRVVFVVVFVLFSFFLCWWGFFGVKFFKKLLDRLRLAFMNTLYRVLGKKQGFYLTRKCNRNLIHKQLC